MSEWEFPTPTLLFGFRRLQPRIKSQEPLERLPFTLVRKLRVALKRFIPRYRNPHILSHLAERQMLFVAFEVDVIAEGFWSGWDWFSGAPVK
jgi:hypothetical protein